MMIRPYFTHFSDGPKKHYIGYVLPDTVEVAPAFNSRQLVITPQGQSVFYGVRFPCDQDDLWVTVEKRLETLRNLQNLVGELIDRGELEKPFCGPERIWCVRKMKGYLTWASVDLEEAIAFGDAFPGASKGFEAELDLLLVHLWGKKGYKVEKPHYRIDSHMIFFEFGFGKCICLTPGELDQYRSYLANHPSFREEAWMHRLSFSSDNLDNPRDGFATLIFIACLSKYIQNTRARD